jgi:hypothetical protein
MNMGFAWHSLYQAFNADRPEGGHCCSDRDYYRALGVDVDAPPKRHPLQRRRTKLIAAIPASMSVFRALMRRPAGGTVVILAPRAERPKVPDHVIVLDERELRDAS